MLVRYSDSCHLVDSYPNIGILSEVPTSAKDVRQGREKGTEKLVTGGREEKLRK
jgi:hypothetical protein